MSHFPYLGRRLAAPFLALGLTVALAACSHVPAQTMWALRSFDPLTTDPARLRAAVAMPQEAFPTQGGAKLEISQVRKGGGDEEKTEIVLEEVSLASETGLGAVKPKPGQMVRAYRIPPAEIPRLLEARRRAKERSEKEPGAFTGTLSVGIDGCRQEGAPVPKTFLVSTWLKTAETQDYVPLLVDLDLVKMVGAEKLTAEAKVCEAK